MGKVRLQNKLPKFLSDLEQKGAVGVTQALITGGAHVAGRTPQNSSNLINSRFYIVKKEGTRIVGTFGYTAPYALVVHEASGKLKGQPRPEENGKARGNYWDPRGEPGFVKKGFEEAEPLIKAIIAGKIKT